MNKQTNVRMHNRINARIDEFIYTIAEEYNPNWNISPKKYVRLIRKKVNKQLKQYKKRTN